MCIHIIGHECYFGRYMYEEKLNIKFYFHYIWSGLCFKVVMAALFLSYLWKTRFTVVPTGSDTSRKVYSICKQIIPCVVSWALDTDWNEYTSLVISYCVTYCVSFIRKYI